MGNKESINIGRPCIPHTGGWPNYFKEKCQISRFINLAIKTPTSTEQKKMANTHTILKKFLILDNKFCTGG